ncbi:unnamed protein product [Adineta steineri]|uniref:Uncharacterized protein n=1 Tax=Adineta steineri TaxID=433720 RepID=A0A815NVN1_9BILA|nr:unnamed protein product [Adineta steineri]CAF1625741.1 unnamed protein product [Adineta steineri]
MFPSALEQYINELVNIHGIHSDSLASILINCVCATLDLSYGLRANRTDNKMSTNLYNMIVARSSYGKSEMTEILRDIFQMVVVHRLKKFRTTEQIVIGENVESRFTS